MASSTMTIQLTSIKYMYICGASYFFVGIILLIVNAFLKKKNRYHIITSIKRRGIYG